MKMLYFASYLLKDEPKQETPNIPVLTLEQKDKMIADLHNCYKCNFFGEYCNNCPNNRRQTNE